MAQGTHVRVKDRGPLEVAIVLVEDVPFSMPGALVLALSNKRRILTDRRYHAFHMELSVAGSSDTEVEVQHNGNVVGTLTIPSGSTYTAQDLVITCSTGDRLQLDLVTAGTGASGLSVFPVYERL